MAEELSGHRPGVWGLEDAGSTLKRSVKCHLSLKQDPRTAAA